MEVHVAWDYRVALDLFLGGVGIGAFLLAAYINLIRRTVSSLTVKLGYLIGPLFVGLGVLALMTELGKPLRMITTYYNFNPESVTSWGGYIQTLFILVGFILFYSLIKNKNKKLFNILQGIGIFLAISVGLYHGLLLATIGRPLWVNGLIPFLFFVSSLLSGGSLLFTISAFLSKKEETKETNTEQFGGIVSANSIKLPILFSSFLVLQILLLFIWRVTLGSTGLDASEAYEHMLVDYGGYWTYITIGLGLVVPLIITTTYSVKKMAFHPIILIMITTFILIGSYLFKHIILYGGQFEISIF